MLAWKRTIKRLLWDSQYDAEDGGDRYRITRHRRYRWIRLFIYRGTRQKPTEVYDYLPTVRYAKAFAETRRREVAGEMAW